MQPDGTAEESTQKKGYQEYAIQQAAYEVPLKSNRYKFHSKHGCLGLRGSATEKCSLCHWEIASFILDDASAIRWYTVSPVNHSDNSQS